jgi:hypothetical protein
MFISSNFSHPWKLKKITGKKIMMITTSLFDRYLLMEEFIVQYDQRSGPGINPT